jgi:coenzyme F420-reducing hydrogenase alpha subunit
LYGDKELILKGKDLYRYKKTLKKIQIKIDEILGYEAKLSLDFIVGIITIINDQLDQVKIYSKNQEYIGSWENLLDNLQALYENYDEEMEYEDCFKTGLKINEEFYKILNYS